LGKSELGEMDYLLLSPKDRPGALGFGLNENPPAPVRNFNKTLQLEELQSIAHRLIKDKPLRGPEAEQVERLLLRGTTMGGARPKAVIEDEEGLWIAKFSHPKDSWNNARVERAMLVLARACGIQTAESRAEPVGSDDVLLVKRFDREKTKSGYRKSRMVSALTLLGAEDVPLANRERGHTCCWSKSCAAFPASPKEMRRSSFGECVSMR
jgi:serine/threonine-protein kinase HipA